MEKRYTRKAISKRIRERMNPQAQVNTGAVGVINSLIQKAQQLRQVRTPKVK
jgi:hypothetical protein